uniref:Putative ovule protein n=1 Tax=Solanum chacoense TaxID=4108 RepID=A0A0V0GPK8_SOLCH
MGFSCLCEKIKLKKTKLHDQIKFQLQINLISNGHTHRVNKVVTTHGVELLVCDTCHLLADISIYPSAVDIWTPVHVF